jgi:broad specificity phosphatase PhoE
LFTLVRHGQTDWNLEGRFQGQADPPLNDAGRAQAQELASRWAGRRFDAVYSSDLQRASETAHIIAAQMGLTVHTDLRLREVNLGVWEGMLGVDVKAQYPAEWQAWRHTHQGHPPGGETVDALAARVSELADEVARRWPSGDVLIVAHSLTLAALICRAERLALDRIFDCGPANAAPVEIRWPPFQA